MEQGETKPTGRPASYASTNMIERRHRMLELAREHITEVGFELFSMSEVARRADVAKRTLYNAWRSKEHLVAAAIAEFSQERSAELRTVQPFGTVAWAVERYVAPTIRARSIKGYLAAMMALYHAPGVDPEIWQAIHDSAVKTHRGWIELLAERGDLIDAVRPEDLIDDLARMKFALVHEWCRGRMSDEESVRRQAFSLLTLVRGAVRAEAQPDIDLVLERLRRDGLDAVLELSGDGTAI